MALRIFVVDDNADIRVLVTFVLGRDPDFVLIGEAEDGGSAVVFVRQHRPDLVVMDLLMPRVGGLDATRQIKREAPGRKVLTGDPPESANGAYARATGQNLVGGGECR